MKITKTELRKLIKEVTQGEMEFAPLEAARQAYLQEPNDDTKHELGLMVNKLVEPIMAEMGLFWEAEAYYNRGELVFNNRSVEVSIDPKGAMGRYDVNVSAQVSAMDTDPAFAPIETSIPSMKGVLQFVNDKVFSSTGMVGEPEAQTELPLGKGGLAREHKVRITKSQLQKIIKEEVRRLAEWGGEGTDHRSPASMLNQANDKLGEALNKMDGMRGAGEWTAQSELIDTHYDTLVGIYEQIKTIKDELAQAGRK